MKPRPPRAPAGIGTHGRALWREITAVFELEPLELRILTEACRTADELERLREDLDAAGSVVQGSTGQPRANPLLNEVRRHREALAKLLSQLQKESLS